MASSTSQVIFHHCNTCVREQQHFIKYQQKKEDSEIINGCAIEWHTTESFIECGGCKSLSLRKAVYCTEDEHEEVTSFPPAVFRQKPKWHKSLSVEYQGLFSEVYDALSSDSRRLVLMGARSLIDQFMTSNGCSGFFSDNLNQLLGDNILTDFEYGILNVAVDAGHAAVHRAYNPTQEDTMIALNILEHILEKNALLNDSKILETHTPKDPRKALKKGAKRP